MENLRGTDGWEDPETEHVDCTGCDMCESWEGHTYEAIRAERRAYLARLADEADRATEHVSMARDPRELEERMTAEFLAED